MDALSGKLETALLYFLYNFLTINLIVLCLIILGGVIEKTTADYLGHMHSSWLSKTPDFLAFGKIIISKKYFSKILDFFLCLAVCLAFCCLSTIGVKLSTHFNSFFTMVTFI